MACKEIFAQIDRLQPQYLQVWEDICNIESPTNYKEGVDAVGNYIIRLAEKMGWRTEVCQQPVAGNAVCITMNPDAPGAPLALSGHMDTVHPVGTFGTTPVRRNGEYLHGPGVFDCKGGIAVGLLAMAALQECGYQGRPVKLLLQADEEVGSSLSNRETVNWICQKAKGSAAFLNLESAKEGEAVISRKGITRYRFTVHGIKSHSAGCPKGASAIAEAAHKILELEKFKDMDGITCNCGLISGGTTPNTVPGECSFVADFRFWTDDELQLIEKTVKKSAETVHIPGCSCSYEQMSYRIAMPKVERNLALLEQVNRILAAEGMPTLVGTVQLGGSDAAYVTAAGIPCLDSLGAVGANAHTENEVAKIASLAQGAKRVAAIVCHL